MAQGTTSEKALEDMRFEELRDAYMRSPTKPQLTLLAKEFGVPYDRVRRTAREEAWDQQRKIGHSRSGARAIQRMRNQMIHRDIQLAENHCFLAEGGRQLVEECLQDMRAARANGEPLKPGEVEKFANALAKVIAIERDANGVTDLLRQFDSHIRSEQNKPKELATPRARVTIEDGLSPEEIGRRVSEAFESKPEDESTDDDDGVD